MRWVQLGAPLGSSFPLNSMASSSVAQLKVTCASRGIFLLYMTGLSMALDVELGRNISDALSANVRLEI